MKRAKKDTLKSSKGFDVKPREKSSIDFNAVVDMLADDCAKDCTGAVQLAESLIKIIPLSPFEGKEEMLNSLAEGILRLVKRHAKAVIDS